MFSLIQFHNWSPEWVEGLVPWEKHVYIDMLTKYLRAAAEDARDQDAINQRKMKR